MRGGRYAENGSLGQTLKAFGKLNERLVAGYVVKILEGLHYLHQCDVVHCDLKAANILTTKNGNVKLSDFGVSLNLRAMEREMKDVAGTPNWMAPEVIELKGASTKADIWSLGCTVIELLTGRPPYGDIANSMSGVCHSLFRVVISTYVVLVMFRIVEDDMPPLPESCSKLLKDFLRQCFRKDPHMRPNAEELCEHEWLKQNWAAHNKEIRPQDSIPFLRRVSADLQKSEAIKYLAKVEMSELDRVTPRSTPEVAPTSPISHRLSHDALSPREHSFVKTTFAKRESLVLAIWVWLLIFFYSGDLSRLPHEREEERGVVRIMQPHLPRSLRPQCSSYVRPPCTAPPLRSVCGKRDS